MAGSKSLHSPAPRREHNFTRNRSSMNACGSPPQAVQDCTQLQPRVPNHIQRDGTDDDSFGPQFPDLAYVIVTAQRAQVVCLVVVSNPPVPE